MNDIIQQLVEAWGPAGFEHRVRALIRDIVTPYVDSTEVDALGNLICRVGTGGTRIMIAAHMDEIGMITLYREPKTGYWRFSPLGGLLPTTMVGARVQFEDGSTGVIGTHDAFGDGRHEASLDRLFIDTSDGERDPITEGSACVIWQPFEARGQRLIGKAMDDRIGCAVAIEMLRRLNKSTPNEVVVVFTVQEEVGIRGARTAAFGVDPHVAIALDVTATNDTPRNRMANVALGAGAAVKIADPGLIVPPMVRDWIIARAEADGIPYQREVLSGGTTDASAIQMARAGVPSGAISIPCRYVHSASETVDVRDVEAAIELVRGLVSNSIVLEPQSSGVSA